VFRRQRLLILLWGGAFLCASRADEARPLFDRLFLALPADVTILPTENYHYWTLTDGGRTYRGNLRLASGRREKGQLHFAYSDDDFVSQTTRTWTAADGIHVVCADAFTVHVTVADHRVTFHLHQIEQIPPRHFALRPGETFIQRTYDESGHRFFLISQSEPDRFAWLLNEESGLPERLLAHSPGQLIGETSGFIFAIDPHVPARKTLVSVSRQHVEKNTAFDGPFDQLADNYADATRLRDHLERVIPAARGRIDRWGYFTDKPDTERVAIVPYATYRPAETQ
jgi:hypothetical protein